MNDTDRAHLTRCVELAEEALRAGSDPFGALLVSGDGRVLLEERNRTEDGDATRHGELAIARWAIEHLSPEERRAATVYTSGEHCPMCAAAHGWAGLGRIVYASSSAQLAAWLAALGAPPAPVNPLPIGAVLPDVVAEGPDPDLGEALGALHARRWQSRGEV